jgi:EmrB/QacA subfamily drug resistance transporter
MADTKPVNWTVFLYTSVGVVLIFSNMTTMDVALPSIVRYFSASPLQANWILLGYMLTNTVMLLAFGRLADIFGRKPLYLIGVAIFTAASLGCGLAPSADILIAFRIVQAIGAAAIITNTTALLVDAYPREQMSLILGLNVSVAAGSSICGPLIGGAFVSGLGWQSLFFFAVPLGVFLLVAGPRVLHNIAPRDREPFDYLGALLSFLALGGLVLALSDGGARGWRDPIILAYLVVSVLAGAAFIGVQLRARYPLVDLSILKNLDLSLAYYATFTVAAAQMATLILVSLFLQAAYAMDAFHAGLHVTGLAAGLVVGTAVSARLIGRLPPRQVAASGMACIAGAMIAMSLAFAGSPPQAVTMTAILAVIGLGVGLFMTPNTTSIMTSVGPERRGVANGLRSMVQNMGFVVGTAMSLAIVTAPLDSGSQHAVYSGQSALLAAAQRDLFEAQYHLVFALLAAVACSAVVACLFRRASSAGVVPAG